MDARTGSCNGSGCRSISDVERGLPYFQRSGHRSLSRSSSKVWEQSSPVFIDDGSDPYDTGYGYYISHGSGYFSEMSSREPSPLTVRTSTSHISLTPANSIRDVLRHGQDIGMTPSGAASQSTKWTDSPPSSLPRSFLSQCSRSRSVLFLESPAAMNFNQEQSFLYRNTSLSNYSTDTDNFSFDSACDQRTVAVNSSDLNHHMLGCQADYKTSSSKVHSSGIPRPHGAQGHSDNNCTLTVNTRGLCPQQLPKCGNSLSVVDGRLVSPVTDHSWASGGGGERRQVAQCRRLPCRTYISNGSCPYGERCHFLHDPRTSFSGRNFMHHAASPRVKVPINFLCSLYVHLHEKSRFLETRPEPGHNDRRFLLGTDALAAERRDT
jgi:hypothetical protein